MKALANLLVIGLAVTAFSTLEWGTTGSLVAGSFVVLAMALLSLVMIRLGRRA